MKPSLPPVRAESDQPHKRTYRFIHFVPAADASLPMAIKPELGAWVCRNNKSGAVLGICFWYARWRQYVFSQYEQGAVFNNGCLTDIVDFMKTRTAERQAVVQANRRSRTD